MCLLGRPSAASTTIRLRNTTRCAVVPARIQPCSVARCSGVIGKAGVRFMWHTVPNPNWKYKTFYDHCTRMRATRPSCQVARRHGRGTRPPGRSCDGRDAAGARGRGSWPPSPMIPTWPGWSTVSRPRMGSSHRVREKPPARRPRVVVEEPAQSRPAPAAAGGARWGRRLSWRVASPGC